MALIFSPISEDILDNAPTSLYPKSAFIMRQIGEPPKLDTRIFEIVNSELARAEYSILDATSTTGGRDFLHRILELIRGTGFTIAIFTEHTRPETFANIAMELGFAVMCGKPLIIVKSQNARPPSDLTRTDWIEFNPDNEKGFRSNLRQAFRAVRETAKFETIKLAASLEAERMDCAIAFERAQKAFLLTGDSAIIDNVRSIRGRLKDSSSIDDVHRLKDDLGVFIRQAEQTDQ